MYNAGTFLIFNWVHLQKWYDYLIWEAVLHEESLVQWICKKCLDIWIICFSSKQFWIKLKFLFFNPQLSEKLIIYVNLTPYSITIIKLYDLGCCAFYRIVHHGNINIVPNVLIDIDDYLFVTFIFKKTIKLHYHKLLSEVPHQHFEYLFFLRFIFIKTVGIIVFPQFFNSIINLTFLRLIIDLLIFWLIKKGLFWLYRVTRILFLD